MILRNPEKKRNLTWTEWRQTKMYFFFFLNDWLFVGNPFESVVFVMWHTTHLGQLMWSEIGCFWHRQKLTRFSLSWTPRPPPRPCLLSGLWLSSMKIFSPSQRMCQHQRPTTAWNSRGQFIKGDVAIGSLFFSACVLAELLSLKFCFFTSIFPPMFLPLSCGTSYQLTNPHPHCFLDCVACRSPNAASISQTSPS